MARPGLWAPRLQSARTRRWRNQESGSFPCVLKLAVPFDQPLKVLLVDGIVETLVFHGPCKFPDSACKQPRKETGRQTKRLSCNQPSGGCNDESNGAKNGPNHGLNLARSAAMIKPPETAFNHDPDAGGW